MPPAISSVTSFTETVTNTREPGPFHSSSARERATNPSSSRFRSGVELNWSAPMTQWWFVAMRPSGETKDALQPPSDTIAPIGWPVSSAKRFASPSKPSSARRGARSGSCCGIHMPSPARAGAASASVSRAARRAFTIIVSSSGDART